MPGFSESCHELSVTPLTVHRSKVGSVCFEAKANIEGVTDSSAGIGALAGVALFIHLALGPRQALG